MDYTELTTSIGRYTQNDESEFTSEIPYFVKLAEKRIFDQAQLLVARKNATSPTVISQQYLQTPTDFLAPYSMAVIVSGVHYPMIFVDETFIREVYPDVTDEGQPAYYSMFDADTFIMGPTPDSSSYSIELHYFYYPESIVTADTTWLGDNAPNALLYGTLLEAYRFMKEEQDVIAEAQKHYDNAMNGLKLLSAARDRGDAYRWGQFRLPVQA